MNIENSDRYMFLKEHKEGRAVFAAGSVVRMSAGDAAPLIESGVLKRVAAYTRCLLNPLAEHSCAPVTKAQREALTVTEIPKFTQDTGSQDNAKRRFSKNKIK